MSAPTAVCRVCRLSTVPASKYVFLYLDRMLVLVSLIPYPSLDPRSVL